ncbi:MAG: recombinase family protein, partial [Actinobacteria bacterium]|nr:recombinase family protein [Actinomycetota bacterium]
MHVVRHIFGMFSEGMPLHAVKRVLEREGVPTPPKPKKREGAPYWSKKTIRDIVLDDAYRPHTHGEVLGLVSPEVAGRLDPKRRYGVWWFNRRRTTHKTVAEVGVDGQREYNKRQKTVEKPKSEWVAVPVPDPGIPRELVDLARLAIKDNRPTSRAGDRFWELSGGVFYCGGCERRMSANRVLQPKTKKPAHYYR